MPSYSLTVDLIDANGVKVLTTSARLQRENFGGQTVWHGSADLPPGVSLPLGRYRTDFPEKPLYADLYDRGRLSLNVSVTKVSETAFAMMGEGELYPTPK